MQRILSFFRASGGYDVILSVTFAYTVPRELWSSLGVGSNLQKEQPQSGDVIAFGDESSLEVSFDYRYAIASLDGGGPTDPKLRKGGKFKSKIAEDIEYKNPLQDPMHAIGWAGANFLDAIINLAVEMVDSPMPFGPQAIEGQAVNWALARLKRNQNGQVNLQVEGGQLSRLQKLY